MTTELTITPRSRAELAPDITRDPIYLFQRRNYIVYPEAHDTYEADDDGDFLDENGEVVDWKRLIDEGLACEIWETETVFFTRAEGEEWGRNRYYRWHYGWRVYCTAAEGSMKDILAAHNEGGRYT